MEKAKFWNYKTASEVTGIPRGTLYALVSEERIPHSRIGPRHVLFCEREVLEWLEQHRVHTKRVQLPGGKK